MKRGHGPFAVALLALSLLLGPAPAAAAPGGGASGAPEAGASAPGPSSEATGGDAAERLMRAYAPILMLREQRDPPCDTSEEQYQPTAVETVLGNPDVALLEYGAEGGPRLVGKAPSAAELAGLGEGFHLDLPGNALGDTCVYARDFAGLKREGRAPAVAYAHIARERGRPGLALQYWFFWYFNQFNDVHEGDWEGMQLAFDASDPEQALREGPREMILFQHAGGERAAWEDDKVKKEGTHPIVYPAAGSHATFYDSTVYVENGQGGSGVGCDNTSEPLRRLDVEPVLLPAGGEPRGEFAWLAYTGRWGELQKGFNNGPTGPNTKRQWREPFAWMEEQRSTSPRLPGGSIAGPAVTGAFCGAVTAVTDLMNLEARSPLAALLTVAAIVLALGLYLGLTRWGPVDVERLRARRAFGQIVRAARQLYGRHWRVLVPVGLTALPIVGGVGMLAGVVAGQHSVDETAGRSGIVLAVADLLEQLGRPVASAIVAAVVIVFVRSLLEAAPLGVRGSFRGMWERARRVVVAQLLATLGVVLMAATVVGIPLAIWKYLGWQFVQQEILFENRSTRDAFRHSSQLVRGQRWHTLRVASFFWLVGIAAGPMLGFVLIFTNFSLFWINVLGSFVFALFVPYVALGHTLLYFDVQARRDEAAAAGTAALTPRDDLTVPEPG